LRKNNCQETTEIFNSTLLPDSFSESTKDNIEARQRKQVGLGVDACAYRRPIMLESKSYAPAKKENDTH
jgi:hypothetical protein